MVRPTFGHRGFLAREFAEKRFAAEQKKYELGVNRLFFVLDAQTALRARPLHKRRRLAGDKIAGATGYDGPMLLRSANEGDADSLVRLINGAFEVERFFIDADRLNRAEVDSRLRSGQFLVAEEAGVLLGCVYLESNGERGYLGLLSVAPGRQGSGIGSKLMRAAERHCLARGCRYLDLRIVNLRKELPPFYRARGYVATGTAPFPPEHPTLLPCHFVTMAKELRQ